MTKSSLLNRVPCVPAWSTCSSVNVSTCNKYADFSLLCANVPINLPTSQGPKGVPIFQLHLPKGVPFCQKNFCAWIFQLSIKFTNFWNISAIVENFSCETKNVNFDICKILLRKLLIITLFINVVFNKACGINWSITRLV